ncbi:hypothetical protein CKO42_16360 [Lamprobacter modestohalophilus]|uniref:Uncharacterized protein n=1 Tax=Lamprobacter modestohalophilus TaxID=1064514 RepID=A0A9X0WAR9_9GAMM|nr:hypothetical protein [Lamprobacter modestohalophilus]MBK1619984.1 hypothetical protein [Lamprobacter modestohalophilus]
MPEYTIDQNRLYDVLDSAQTASSTMSGIRSEIEALRGEINQLSVGIEASRTGTLGQEANPQSLRVLQGRKEQLRRLQSRQSEGHQALMPRIELGRRAVEYARKKGMAAEVAGYVY